MMMEFDFIRGLVLIVATLGATGCASEERNQTVSEDPSIVQFGTGNPLPAVRYGPARPVRGKFFVGRETQAFGLCEVPREQCHLPPRGGPCWAEFGPEAQPVLARLMESDGSGGEYWIEGTGRVSVEQGEYGHVGGYLCQIQIDEIRLIETGPPHMYEPPPPEENALR